MDHADRADRCRQSQTLSGRHAGTLLRAAAPREPVHCHRQREFGPYWSVTKYNDIMKVDTNQPDILVGFGAGRHHAPRPPTELRCRCSSPWTRRSTTSSARWSARSSRRPTWRSMDGDHPRARRQDPGRPAARRDIRLGRSCLDRADHPDAGHAVRLPVRGAAQADLLVGRRHGDRAPATAIEVRGEARRGLRRRWLDYFTALWNERVNAPPRSDLISMLAHGEATRNMRRRRSTWATWCC